MNEVTVLPTPADKIVAYFVSEILKVKPQFVEGVYLIGSLPLNDFYFKKSDIDFIVLCKKFPDKNVFIKLKQIHKIISQWYSKPDLSGSYLTLDSILTNHPTDIKTLSFHQGTLQYDIFEMAPVSLSELNSNALTIFGKPAESLQIRISLDNLNRFLFNNINSYWTKWLNQHSKYFKKKLLLLLFPRLTEWSVLGVARQLCTFQTGKIVSKSEAGRYCLLQLPHKFHSIINEALEIRKDNKTYPFVKSYAIKPSFRRLIQTIHCVDYIISIFNKEYIEKQGSH